MHENFCVDELPNSLLRDVYTYWLDMQGDRLMPPRSDLNPTDIVKLLPNLLLIDVEPDPRRYKYRLVGTATANLLDADPTGRYLDDMLEAENYLKEKYDWVVREKKPYFYAGNAKWARKSYLRYSCVVMPLSTNGTDVDILMVGVHYQLSCD